MITSAIGDVALAPLMRRVEVGDSVEVVRSALGLLNRWEADHEFCAARVEQLVTEPSMRSVGSRTIEPSRFHSPHCGTVLRNIEALEDMGKVIVGDTGSVTLGEVVPPSAYQSVTTTSERANRRAFATRLATIWVWRSGSMSAHAASPGTRVIAQPRSVASRSRPVVAVLVRAKVDHVPVEGEVGRLQPGKEEQITDKAVETMCLLPEPPRLGRDRRRRHRWCFGVPRSGKRCAEIVTDRQKKVPFQRL